MKLSKLLPNEVARAEALQSYALSKKKGRNPSAYYCWANGNEVLGFLRDMITMKKERFEVQAHKVGLSPTSLRIKLYDGRKYMQDNFKDISDEDYNLLERMHVVTTATGAVVVLNPDIPVKSSLSDLLKDEPDQVIVDPTQYTVAQIQTLFLDFMGTNAYDNNNPTLSLKGLELRDDEVLWFKDILENYTSDSLKEGFMGTITKDSMFIMDMRHPINQLQLGIPAEEKETV